MAVAWKKGGGTILVTVGILFLIGAVWATITYLDGVGTLEDNKEYRDSQIDEDTSSMNQTIEDQEETLDTKEYVMGICFPVAVITLIGGILLLVSYYKKKKGAVSPSPPQNTQNIPGQPPSPP